MGFIRNSNDTYFTKDQRETQIANTRQLQKEARDEGDTKFEATATERMDHALDNYSQEERLRGGK